MTRRFLFLLCAAALAATAASAQSVEARLKQIRDTYAARLDLMNNKPYDDPGVEQMTVSFKRNIPGTGLFDYTSTFYWTDDEDEQYMLRPTLYFATCRYSRNMGMYGYTREYLFDPVTEQPMFMLITTQVLDSPTRLEFRFYFDEQGRLIKQLPEAIGPCDDGDVLAPDVPVDDNGVASGEALLNAFESVKDDFHHHIATYKWE